MSDVREAWAKQAMASIAGGGGGPIGKIPNAGDDWTQEDIDRSLANEAKIQKAMDQYAHRLDRLLDNIAGGHEPAAGFLTDLQRDRKTLEEMLAAMQRARGYRVKAKDTVINEREKQS